MTARQVSGLSPRLRGNHDVCMALTREHPGVYPRACGGTGPLKVAEDARYGLSPRLRGNHFPVYSRVPFIRSIPAPAGEPNYTLEPISGLFGHRSIPAPAGEPGWARLAPLVYPGSIPAPAGEPTPMRFALVRHPQRSIPAPAGEPDWARLIPLGTFKRSIPAPAGEPNSRNGVIVHLCKGLSPRLRGNLYGAPRTIAMVIRVYPRACGGTMIGSSSWLRLSQ